MLWGSRFPMPTFRTMRAHRLRPPIFLLLQLVLLVLALVLALGLGLAFRRS
eukprot:COSAG02_NODE_18_length_54986_cov_345.599322_34_plen_51_part_00